MGGGFDNGPMETVVHPGSGLTKATWTDQDLDAMTWHACQIHAIALTGDEGPPDDLTADEFLEKDDLDPTAPSGMALHFDLDYIVRRIEPSAPGRGFEFWVAPATLIFGCVWAISGNLRTVCLPFETRNLSRLTPMVPRDKAEWHLEGRDFDLTFMAWSFALQIRRPPRLGHRVLRRAERGGISFEARPFA